MVSIMYVHFLLEFIEEINLISNNVGMNVMTHIKSNEFKTIDTTGLKQLQKSGGEIMMSSVVLIWHLHQIVEDKGKGKKTLWSI